MKGIKAADYSELSRDERNVKLDPFYITQELNRMANAAGSQATQL